MRRLTLTRSLRLGTSLLSFLAAACSAGGKDPAIVGLVEDEPAGGGGTGNAGTANDPLTPPGTGSTGFDLGDDVGEPVAPAGCQQAAREFDPQIPTVFIVVDRSFTMFDPIPPSNITAWDALRTGTLEVIRELEGSVRFGFASFAGPNGGGPMCMMDYQSVAPKLDNYADIAGLYEGLERLDGFKETPMTMALAEAAEQLRADPEDGDKYILFVTDGEPDYCDDGNALCPPDSVVGLLQGLAAPTDATGQPQVPIRTLVFGISAPTVNIRAEVLQAFANAGVGEPVAPFAPPAGQPYRPERIYNECNSVPGWSADFLATGKPQQAGQSIGTYTDDPSIGGTARVYRPDPNEQAALTNEIRAALAGVKSCTFDLAEDGVQVDLSRMDLGERARVIVNGSAVPLDAENGWHMLSETTVQLEGEACNAWRNPTIQTSISFDFPCDIFIPR